MPVITIVFELVDKGGPEPFACVVGYSLNQALPIKFWYTSGYVVGWVYLVGDIVKTSISVKAGRNYIVFGTSANYSLGFWTDIRTYVVGTLQTLGTSANTTKRVHSDQYGYITFDVSPDGIVTKVGDGMVEPGKAPPVTSVSGGGGGQTIEQIMADIGLIIQQMMRQTMPPMIQMMGMMMMIQMMQGMTEVFAVWS
jgi:hypothetical protein